MNRVWIVMDGDYDGDWIEEVFANEEDAHRFAEDFGGEVEERPVLSAAVPVVEVHERTCEVAFGWYERAEGENGQTRLLPVGAGTWNEDRRTDKRRAEELNAAKHQPVDVQVWDYLRGGSRDGLGYMGPTHPRVMIAVSGTDEEGVDAAYRSEIERARERLHREHAFAGSGDRQEMSEPVRVVRADGSTEDHEIPVELIEADNGIIQVMVDGELVDAVRSYPEATWEAINPMPGDRVETSWGAVWTFSPKADAAAREAETRP